MVFTLLIWTNTKILAHIGLLCFVSKKQVIFFDSFGIEHVPDEIKNFTRHKNIISNIFRVQESNSIMCGYFCVGFIHFMLVGKTLVDFTSFFFPYDLFYPMIL